jgi:hypothetical protein
MGLSAAGYREKNYGIALFALLQSDQLDFVNFPFLYSFQDTKCSLVLMFLFFQLLLPKSCIALGPGSCCYSAWWIYFAALVLEFQDFSFAVV